MTHTSTEQERAAFEEFASVNGERPEFVARNEAGEYLRLDTAIGWMWWKAASSRVVLGSEPVALLWQHAITGQQFVNLKNQDVPAEPHLFLVGLLCLATVASVPTESTPDPRRAADDDKAWSLHP